jgi:hypothetical protein
MAHKSITISEEAYEGLGRGKGCKGILHRRPLTILKKSKKAAFSTTLEASG